MKPAQILQAARERNAKIIQRREMNAATRQWKNFSHILPAGQKAEKMLPYSVHRRARVNAQLQRYLDKKDPNVAERVLVGCRNDMGYPSLSDIMVTYKYTD